MRLKFFLLLCFFHLTVAARAVDQEILPALFAFNDAQAEATLGAPLAGRGPALQNRPAGARLLVCAASYASPVSRLHHDARLVPAIDALVGALAETQLSDGLFDSGNLDSPPDTAFILETLCQVQSLLARDASAATAPAREKLKSMILRAAEGVRTGGVHTPNHRWHVCAALAHVNQLYADPRWLTRIDEWLAEGIDLDRDGEFAERSPHYSAEVVNPALLTLAVLLNRPQLLEPVRKNLELMLYHVEPNGEVENVASRRQDQRPGAHEWIWSFYVPFRFLAVHDGNGAFAAIARRIEREFLPQAMAPSFSPNAPLAWFLELPELTRPLPADAPLPENFARVFPQTAMARIRRGATTATIYGGSDAHTGLGVGSGLAMNPAFFKFRKGAAILESIRMTPAFFGTGFFYSDGLAVTDGIYRLHETLNVPYHQPLPAEFRKADGDYALSPDGRYFSKLDFAHRPKQFRTLNSSVAITERDGVFDLEFAVDGVAGVPVTIELAFRGDGTLEGVTPRGDAFVLEKNIGRFTAGGDTIEFGPGSFARPPGRMEGEDYTWVNGSLRAEGQRVYLTGVTPLHHRLTIK